jgi:hypothetical protein
MGDPFGAEHVPADGGEHVPDENHHAPVVAVGLVDLQHRELRVVLARDALVAEVAPDLKDAVEPADEHPLQVELERNAQEEIHAERVVVGRERLRRRAARDRLEDRGLDLDELPILKEPADHRDDPRAQEQPFARLAVHDEVEVALAVHLLGVGETVPLLGERPEGLGEKHARLNPHGDLARLRLEERPPGADDVPEVELLEGGVGLRRR